MKHLMLLCTILIFASSFQACKKKADPDDPDPNNPSNPATENVFTCKLDGDVWEPDLVRIRLVNDILSIQGQNNQQQALTITIDAQATGSYSLEISSPHSASFLPAPGEDAYLTGISALAAGIVEITELDVVNKKISADFQFNLYRTDGTFIQFTEGDIVDHDIE